MSLSIPARPTTYRGIQMRSRLEARFARWLDLQVGGDDLPEFEWEYEPRAYAGLGGQYLPDFVIRFHLQTELVAIVEVKPTIPAALLALQRMQTVWESEPEAQLWVAIPGAGIWFGLPRERRWVWSPGLELEEGDRAA